MLALKVFVIEMQAEGESIIRKAEQRGCGEGMDYKCKMLQDIPADEIIKCALQKAQI